MSKPILDIKGERYGRLVVLSFDKIHQNKAYWNVKCDCGKYDIARSDRLRLGRKKSCGCLYEEKRTANLYRNKAREKINRYEKALNAILEIAEKENNEKVMDIIIPTLHGYDFE